MKSTTKKNTVQKAKAIEKTTKVRTIDQLTIARLIAQKYDMKLSDVVSIIEEEQKLTMEYARMGYKVIKKNYLTIESKRYEGKENWVSPLDGTSHQRAYAIYFLFCQVLIYATFPFLILSKRDGVLPLATSQ